MSSETRGLVAPSEIAEMAGVSRAAVSNWRANERIRFPQPTGGSEAKPLFDIADVTAWLIGRGYRISQDRGERLIWSLLNHFRGEWSIEAMTDALMSVLTARRLAALSYGVRSAWDDIVAAAPASSIGAFRRLGDIADNENPAWRGLVHMPAAIDRTGANLLSALVDTVDRLDETDLAYVADDALSRVTAAQARSAGEHGLVGSRVAMLLSSFAVNSSAGVVYDPACGIGETLIRAHDSLSGPARLVGHDVSFGAVRMAHQRCLLAGIDVELTVANVLERDPDPALRADLVLAEPPFGQRWESGEAFADPRWAFGLAPKSSSEMAWIQHAIHHLNAGGRAYVVTSAGPLFRGAERAIRAELLRQACVEAVIGLPGKMLPHTSIPLVLWALCRPGESRDADSVLLVDASEMPEPEKQVRDWLALGHRTDPDDAPPYARVDVRDLLASDSLLQPQHWIGQPDADPSAVDARYRESAKTLAHAAASLARHSLANDGQVAFSTPRMVAVKDLVQLSSAGLTQGRIMRDEIGDLGVIVVTPHAVRDGVLPLDQAAEARSSEGEPFTQGERTQPGDVLVTAVHEVRTVVDKQGGHLIGSGVYRLRVDLTQCDPSYIAYCLTGGWNERHLMGTTVKRADVRSLEVPLIPLDEQRQVVARLDLAQAARRAAETLASAAASLTASLLDVVRYGVSVGEDNV